jgi:hypothetical protein
MNTGATHALVWEYAYCYFQVNRPTCFAKFSKTKTSLKCRHCARGQGLVLYDNKEEPATSDTSHGALPATGSSRSTSLFFPLAPKQGIEYVLLRADHQELQVQLQAFLRVAAGDLIRNELAFPLAHLPCR